MLRYVDAKERVSTKPQYLSSKRFAHFISFNYYIIKVINWTKRFDDSLSLRIIHDHWSSAIEFPLKIDVIEIFPSKLFSEVERKYFEILLGIISALIRFACSKDLFFACL